MKLVIIMAHGLRILANGMRCVENKLCHGVWLAHRRMANFADAAYGRATQRRSHAVYLDTDYRNEKIGAAVTEVNTEIDRRVSSAYLAAEKQNAVGDRLYDILGGCK